MKLIGSRLGDHVDHAGRVAAVLGRVAAGDDAKLLNGLGIWRRVAGAAQSGGVVTAVELEVDAADLTALRSVDRGVLLGTAQRVRALVAGDAARDAEQRVKIAVHQRKVQDFVLADGARKGGGGGLHQRRVCDDRHGLGDVAGLDRGVNTGVAPDLEQDARLREILEAVERDVNFVVAERKEQNGVLPGLVGRRRARELGIHIRHGDRRTRDSGSRSIGDVTQNCSGGDLRTGGPGSEEAARNQSGDRPASYVHHVLLENAPAGPTLRLVQRLHNGLAGSL